MTLQGELARVIGVMICHRGELITVEIADVSTAQILVVIPQDASLIPTRLSVKYPHVAVGYTAGCVKIFDLQTGELISLPVSTARIIYFFFTTGACTGKIETPTALRTWMVLFHDTAPKLFVMRSLYLVCCYDVSDEGKLVAGSCVDLSIAIGGHGHLITPEVFYLSVWKDLLAVAYRSGHVRVIEVRYTTAL